MKLVCVAFDGGSNKLSHAALSLASYQIARLTGPLMHRNKGVNLTCYSTGGKMSCKSPAAGTCWTTGGVCPADADRYDQEGITSFCGITPLVWQDPGLLPTPAAAAAPAADATAAAEPLPSLLPPFAAKRHHPSTTSTPPLPRSAFGPLMCAALVRAAPGAGPARLRAHP
eukprot:CAMPEP_0172214178 /NCGR_PEP_ID=MMETSP1050-20130122/38016_1 /TAXON_ID=233186 /ORGANISM="Cryptomonas curvata, Strain CCAP979/52" /LENGTH=169 /DNA_ID=CAMNT_0012895117 /DNA_START=47 /DNA_END=553 /DNA_ORIENTATION=-